MARLGDSNRAFTRKALEIAMLNPDFLPRSFDLDEMQRDLELFESLQPIRQTAVSGLQSIANQDEGRPVVGMGQGVSGNL